TELISCQRNEVEDHTTDNNELAVRSLLDISDEAMQIQRTSIWKRVFITAVTLLLLALVIGYLALNVPKTTQTRVLMKQAIGTNYFIYIEEKGHLIRLRCPDEEMYNDIATDGETVYNIRSRWNKLTYRGSVISCKKEDYVVIGTTLDMAGSAIGIDQLFDRRCVFQQYFNITADPYRPGKFLYTFRYFYYGDGSEYFFEGEETPLLMVNNCRWAYPLDYDNDGIAELFVLTRYDEEPYMLYDMENGEITSCFVDKVPSEILELFQQPR
ncbi:MAG: hypothetical protein IKC03_04035, partial [Oscillospiraceae bacterium]|nr:hypothetical protein [Oscillospiraceae bacterium]